MSSIRDLLLSGLGLPLHDVKDGRVPPHLKLTRVTVRGGVKLADHNVGTGLELVPKLLPLGRKGLRRRRGRNEKKKKKKEKKRNKKKQISKEERICLER